MKSFDYSICVNCYSDTFFKERRKIKVIQQVFCPGMAHIRWPLCGRRGENKLFLSHLYTGGSLACGAVFSPDLEPPLGGGWVGRRLQNHSSSTLCELCAILEFVSLICQTGVNTVVICDCKLVLQFLSAVQPTHLLFIQQILSFLTLKSVRGLCVKFIWIPSHVGLRHNVTADRLAKEASPRPHRGDGRPLSIPCYLPRVRSAVLRPV